MAKNDDGWLTDEEHEAKLRAEGKWEERETRRAQAEEERRIKREAMDRDLDPVNDALRAGGVSESWEALDSDNKKSYDAAVPILLEQLRLEYPDHVKMTILMILQSARVKPYWDELVDIFENNSANLSDEVRPYAGFVFSNISNDARIDDLIRLVRNKSIGASRRSLLLALSKSKSPKVKMLLNEMKEDPDLKSEIKRMRRLKRYKDL